MTQSSLLLLFLLSLSAMAFLACRYLFGDLDEILPETPKEIVPKKKAGGKSSRKKKAAKKNAKKKKGRGRSS